MSIDNATPEEWYEVGKKLREESRLDAVNSPAHYNQGGIECIEAIEAMLNPEEFIGYCRGNSMKYRWRFRAKNGVEDLRKAEWYEKRMLSTIIKKGIS